MLTVKGNVLSKEEALKIIATKMGQAEALISECEDLADEHDVDFSFHPAYGMGGWYKGEKDGYGEEGWNPSSQSC